MMGWIDIEEQMPPEGLHVLVEASWSGTDEHGVTVMADHGFYIGTWVLPEGEEEIEWLLQTKCDIYYPTIHAWMPLPKHYQPQTIFTQEPDLMEHAMFDDDPEWLYKGDAVYEQMSIEEFLKEAEG